MPPVLSVHFSVFLHQGRGAAKHQAPPPKIMTLLKKVVKQVVNLFCFYLGSRYLYSKLELSRKSTSGPMAARNISLVSSKDVSQFFTSESPISSVFNTVESVRLSFKTNIMSSPDVKMSI